MIWWSVGYRTPGTYSTDRLMQVASLLRSYDVPQRILDRVFVPFVIGGNAHVWDSWGEVRKGSDPHSLRPHLGQDVFCDTGTPVLASEEGRIELTTDNLGGLVARLHVDDGSYWYYAHLSSYNEDVEQNENVQPGDVIGYCGQSGNAAGTPPHVHFAHYVGGTAVNPMPQLISWLQRAEVRGERLLRKYVSSRVRSVAQATTVRRFGEPFVPDLSELDCDEGSGPATIDLITDPVEAAKADLGTCLEVTT